MISYETQLNLATAARAVITRLDGDGRKTPERWYVVLADEQNKRASVVCNDEEGFMVLFPTARDATIWLDSVRPDLAVSLRDSRHALTTG